MYGGATSPEIGVYAYVAAHVKKAIEVTHYLGGKIMSFGTVVRVIRLFSTLIWRESSIIYRPICSRVQVPPLVLQAQFSKAVIAYKKKIGFTESQYQDGQLLCRGNGD